jgi:hypothetical protein
MAPIEETVRDILAANRFSSDDVLSREETAAALSKDCPLTLASIAREGEGPKFGLGQEGRPSIGSSTFSHGRLENFPRRPAWGCRMYRTSATKNFSNDRRGSGHPSS